MKELPGGVRLVRLIAPLPAQMVKDLAFQVCQEVGEEACFVAGTYDQGKPLLTVMLGKKLIADGLHAGNLVRQAARLIQGGGGGAPHFATAGGKNPDGLKGAVGEIVAQLK